MKNDTVLREHVRQGFQSVQEEASEEEVERLVAKVKRCSKGSLPGLAFVAARNRAIDLRRERDRQPRMRARELALKLKEAERENARLQDELKLERCRAEFNRVKARLPASVRKAQAKRFEVFRLFVLDKLPREEIMKRLGVSRDNLYQRKRRAVVFLWPYLSEEFRSLLDVKPPGS